MQKLAFPNAYSWSRWQADRGMYFNSHLFVVEGGNVAVDPLALDDGEIASVEALGGIAWIVVTNRDHLRATAEVRDRFGARVAASLADSRLLEIPVDRTLGDGEETLPGARVMLLEHQKTPGEFAIHFEEQRTLLVGDAIFGHPAGSLSLPPNDKFADVKAAALGLRRLLLAQPETLLVGDGASLWSGATKAIARLLHERAGIAANRVNIDELPYEAWSELDGKYAALDADAGFFIGSEQLGYRIVKLPPGARYCPIHAEFAEEELFIVLDGEPAIKTPEETLRCRKGDLIAFPTGPDHAHQVLNESDREAMLLLLGINQAMNICYYPDSDKVLAEGHGRRWMLRATPILDYFDRE